MVDILIACEESQAVTVELVKLGINAYSCDLMDTSGPMPERHIKDDIRYILKHHNWGGVIAFPPCDHLAVSGARWFRKKRADGRQQAAIEFFMGFTRLDIPYAIENPIGIMSSHFRKPDQIIQPWQFGHGETKATCLWLNNLPLLLPTNIVNGREQRIWKMPPSKKRKLLRSKTYPGIATAMAEQWGPVLVGGG